MSEAENMIAFKGEVQLAGWGETHNGGAKVTFWLQSSEDLEAFRRMTVAKGKIAGQRLMLVAVEIGDDERPVVRHGKGPGLTRLAAMWCEQPPFRVWLKSAYPPAWATAEAVTMFGSEQDVAAEVVRSLCEVKSRAELDTNAAAQQLFHSRIRLPYLACLGEPAGEML